MQKGSDPTSSKAPSIRSTDRRICAAVITYYPDAEIPSRIASFTPHVRETVIVDNHSDDVAVALLRKLSSKPDVHLILNPANLGVATALNQAAGWAIERGYGWLLTMDQDSSFDAAMADAYFSCFRRMADRGDVAVFSPTHLLEFKKPPVGTPTCDFDEVPIVMMSGNIIRLDVHERVGGFDDKLFIDEVDHDYCLRCQLNGYKILKFKDISLNHKLGYAKNVGRGKYIRVHSAERLYYISRNYFYIRSKYKSRYPDAVRQRQRQLLRIVKNILRYEEDKGRKLGNVLRGFLSFLIGKYGP